MLDATDDTIEEQRAPRDAHATDTRYPMTAFPEGWFRVGWTHALEKGDVVPLRAFGRDLVLYRGESGEAHLLDAYCPHVGAHLGHGGRVEGDTIACPFHGWRMNGAGACVHVPLAKKIPPRASVRSWPVREVSGAILAWHHPTGAPPRWIPDPVELPDGDWTRPEILEPWRIPTHVQEFGENAIDLGHAVFLHRHVTRQADTISTATDGPILSHVARHHYKVFALAEWMGKRVVGTLATRCDGFGRVAIHACVDAGFRIEHRIVFYPTPIDTADAMLHATVSLRKMANPVATHLLHRKSVSEARKTIDQDVPIWSNKRYVQRPLLVEGEQAMGRYRIWARQFYPEPRVRLPVTAS